MHIRLNGRRTAMAGGTSIGDLIRSKNLDPETVVVEHNLSIVSANEWDRITLEDDDTLEVLRFVGGG